MELIDVRSALLLEQLQELNGCTFTVLDCKRKIADASNGKLSVNTEH